MKIAINKCWGGFGLSDKAMELYQELSGKECGYWDIERNDPFLIEVIETLGEDANRDYSELRIVEIPDDVQWDIHNYDGMEHVEEQHRKWS